MRLLALLLALSFVSSVTYAKPCKKKFIKIAVIDSGFGFKNLGHEAHLCKYGHKDFSFDNKLLTTYDTVDAVPEDFRNHGTNIVGVIDNILKNSDIDYCIVVLKYFAENQTGQQNLRSSIEAIQYASNLKVDYINYSGGGAEFSVIEYNAVKDFLDHGGKFVAAAGNDYSNLDESGNSYYPAMYDKRIIVVGNNGMNGVRLESSNYGHMVKRWEVGENINAYGLIMTGTSQATAIATGKIASERKCDIRN